MSISNASFRLPVEPGADLYVFGSPKNTEGYQFFARGSRVIFEPNKTTPNPTRALVENDGGVPTVTGVCAHLTSCTRGVGGAGRTGSPSGPFGQFYCKTRRNFWASR